MVIRTRGEKIFNVVNIIIMLLLSFAMLYPVCLVLGRSFMTDVDRATRPFAILPREIDLSAYAFIFSTGSYILNAYAVTILRTVLGTAFNLFFTCCLSYVLSKKYYPYRGFLLGMVVFTMWFGGGLIPTFFVIRMVGLYDNFWVYIIPGLISAWNMLILRNFFMEIPDALEEAAHIDGASEIDVLFRIVLPMSTAALATIGLFYMVGHWNAWFDALIYVNQKKLWPIQVFLRQILSNATTQEVVDPSTSFPEALPPSESVKMAIIVVAMLPMMIVYPFLQKYFVQGMKVGAIKG